MRDICFNYSVVCAVTSVFVINGIRGHQNEQCVYNFLERSTEFVRRLILLTESNSHAVVPASR